MKDEGDWYLLYDGSSVDGRGDPTYKGRTKSKKKAIKHFKEVKSSPYSCGRVVIVNDDKEIVASWEEDFE